MQPTAGALRQWSSVPVRLWRACLACSKRASVIPDIAAMSLDWNPPHNCDQLTHWHCGGSLSYEFFFLVLGGHCELYPSQEANKYKFEVPIGLTGCLLFRPCQLSGQPCCSLFCQDKELVAFWWLLRQPVSYSEAEE